MGFLWSQFFVTPVYPRQSFAGKTVIVTGSNVGLGLEAARHIVRLEAKKVILAVRNLEAGEKAKLDIETTTKRSGICEIWHLDLASNESVKSFAEKAKQLDRLDILLENAGVSTGTFRIVEGHESAVTVNFVSTFLLALLLLPKLEETAQKFNTQTTISMVSSEVHAWAKFPEKDSPNILEALNDEKTFDGQNRYMVTKLLEVLTLRHIAPMVAKSKNKDVTYNMLNPGLCHSSLGREAGILFYIFKLILARTTEVGGRTLVHGAAGTPETHGKYMHDGKVDEGEVAAWVKSEEGERVGAQLWKELSAKLEVISPGVTKNLE